MFKYFTPNLYGAGDLAGGQESSQSLEVGTGITMKKEDLEKLLEELAFLFKC